MIAKLQAVISSAIAEGKGLVVRIYSMCYEFASRVVGKIMEIINSRKAV